MRLPIHLPLTVAALFATWSCQSHEEGLAPSEPAADAGTATSVEDPETVATALESSMPAPSAAARQDDDLDDAAERLALLRQRAQFVSDQYVEQGGALVDEGDLEGALEAYAKAREAMPSNQAAIDGLRHVRVLLGDDLQETSVAIDDLVARETVRREMRRMEAEGFVVQGELALRDGDYAGAVEHFRRAELLLQYEPLISTDSLDLKIVQNKLESALTLQEEDRIRRQQQIESEAEAARLEAEAEARDQKVRMLNALYRDAWHAYQTENYRQAENLARQILLHDPGNDDAILMRDVAAEARHNAVDERTRRDMTEQWLRTFQDLEIQHVPQWDPIVYDLERWASVSQRIPHSIVGDTSGLDQNAEILDRLENTRLAPRFGVDNEGAPLEDIAQFMQSRTGVNFVISTTVRDELDEEETSIYLHLPERSALKVLDMISTLSESLRWKIEDGVVKFVTVDELVGGQVLRMFDVQDLIHPVRDFPGRDINVEPSGGLDPIFEDLDERDALVVTSDTLETLILENVAVESWDLDPNNALRITDQGVLVVNQTPEVQEQIQSLLDDLREATGIMVDIQTRFLTVEDNFLEDIGVDARGLGIPGEGDNVFFDDFGDQVQQELSGEIGLDNDAGLFLDEGDNGALLGRIEQLYDIDLGDEDTLVASGGLSFQWVYLNDLQMELILRAVSKSERVEIVTAPRVLVFNTARANLTVMNQVAYLQDFDVEIAQGSSIADPIVNVVQDGVILDVRPVVSADRRFITLEMRPTVATLVRPIREVTTTLGGSASVTIELPELDISRVRTSVPMPDRSTIMLGGMKLSERQDLRSGIPILNKIPVLSLLFERKGTYIARKKLLILLHAQIVIPEEHEPSFSQLEPLMQPR